MFRAPLAWRISSLFFLALTLCTCNKLRPERAKEPSAAALTARFTNAVRDAGGAQIRIKHPTAGSQGKSSGTQMEALATPAGYHAVMSAVRAEARRHRLDLKTSSPAANGLAGKTDLLVTRRGERIFQLHLREVPRLLRAAIVIDDMGHDIKVAEELLALDAPLTFSVLPHLRFSRMTALEIHRSGREVMLHLPMEAEPGSHVSPGEGAILVGMNTAQVTRTVQGDLASVPFVVGVNNHMGSRATQDAALMADVMTILAEHRLYFIDSRTTASSQALNAACRQNLPAFYRSVFLDNTETVSYTVGQLRQFRQTVEREGVAIAIGHPHPTTIAALAKFLPEFERDDIELVAPSQIVRLPEIARILPPGTANCPISGFRQKTTTP
jgi:polysaccharide deacetylase 2 family uncharacterized protein YibQ